MLICADARYIPLPNDSVQCVVTSPPYWGLRKYAGEQERIWPSDFYPGFTPQCNASGHSWQIEEDFASIGTCLRCGAWRGAFGLEPTVEMYGQHSLEILREIRRVLRPDGVLFWNIGDSYMGSGQGWCTQRYWRDTNKVNRARPPGYISAPQLNGTKPKDLALIPERVALAAQADGWWVRARIIWAKPNPMPESVSDRPTKSHETIWMLTKSERYYWDKYAVMEPADHANERKAQLRGPKNAERQANGDFSESAFCNGFTGNRNMRDVWEFATQPNSGAHFATFPEELPWRCILAATSAHGACAHCGAPWQRRVKVTASAMNICVRDAAAGRADADEGYKATREEIENYSEKPRGKSYFSHTEKDFEEGARGQGPGNDDLEFETVGWQATCKCKTEAVKACLILDPFGGSGTTGRAAIALRRRAVILDLAYTRSTAADHAKGRDYVKLARRRTRNVQLEAFL